MTTVTRFLRLASFASLLAALPLLAAPRWTPEQAHAWQQQTGWLVGCNYAPASAINPLEMWQEDTFDPASIDRELGWAEGLGFNSVRVFLHNLPWKQDARGFARRIDRFLEIADKHHIGVMFVLLDAVWDPFPKAGKQRDPKPHVHNSGWVQAPGVDILKDPSRHDQLRPYINGILRRYGKDRRVHAWDLFNEPDNLNRPAYVQHEPPNKAELSFALLRKVFAWAREANPSQPLTVGVWLGDWSEDKLSPFNRYQLEESDVISFHNYSALEDIQARVKLLQRYQRPILCTEYMARPVKSTFNPVLGYLKAQQVGAYNWGFVAGKTQTIYPWDSWDKTYTSEPPLWFHDIFRQDGTAYDAKEAEYIRSVTGKK